jgi:2-polyprenyl-3-methyl-5-hydroxy-6-metoxy-1,4-benzoquinol methylase
LSRTGDGDDRGSAERSRIYQQERAAARAYSALYDAAYETPYLNAERKDFVRRIARYASANGIDLETARVLDVGCGTGNLIPHLRYLDTTNLHGIDISSEMVALAQEKFPEVEFTVGAVSDSGYEPGSFDLVVGFSVLHHLPDLAEFFSWLAVTLRPGGVFGFIEPNADALIHDHAWAHRVWLPTLPLYRYLERRNRKVLRQRPDMSCGEFYSDAHRHLVRSEILNVLPPTLEADVSSHGVFAPQYQGVLAEGRLDGVVLRVFRMLERLVPAEGYLLFVQGRRPWA